MMIEREKTIRCRDELYSSLSRVKALCLIWEDDRRVEAARGLRFPSGDGLSGISDKRREELIMTVAQTWALFEVEVLQRKRSDVDIAVGMAAALRDYRDDQEFLNEISERVDKLLDDMLEK